MKKIVSTALACVAFATSGFASNEVVTNTSNLELLDQVYRERTYKIRITDTNDNYIGTIIYIGGDLGGYLKKLEREHGKALKFIITT